MVEFIKSIFIPRRMVKHRFMSVFIAICLFVCSTYILVMPAKWNYTKNADKNINENNLVSLQAIRDLPRAGEEFTLFVNDIKSKGLVTEKGVLSASNLGIKSIEVSGNVIGYLTKNTDENLWCYNGKNTEVAISDNSNNTPNVIAVDNGIIIANVNEKKVEAPGVVAGETIDVINLTVDEKTSCLIINDKVYERVISDEKFVVSIDNNKLIVNNEITDVTVTNKAIIYFTPKVTKYYERTFSYIASNGVKTNLLFAINLNVATTENVPFSVEDTKYDYLNEEYFFIVCNLSSVYYQAHLKGIKDKAVEHNGNVLVEAGYNTRYGTSVINSEDINVDNFGTYFLNIFKQGYVELCVSNFTFIALLYLMFFTLIISLLFSLLFRRNGRLKKFKEYYNIASLANLIPLVITFVFTFINPAWFGTVYLTTFTIYYLFVLYRINNSPEMV